MENNKMELEDNELEKAVGGSDSMDSRGLFLEGVEDRDLINKCNNSGSVSETGGKAIFGVHIWDIAPKKK